ncbi:hypothetical protein PENSUB_7243, partial [Penicillium subrubescens]
STVMDLDRFRGEHLEFDQTVNANVMEATVALVRCCNDQALELFGRRQAVAVAALNDGIVEVLKASEKRAYGAIE